MVNERVRGETLSCAWPTMSTADKTRMARQTAEYLGQLRELQSSRTESLGDPVYSAYLFCNDFGISHRPFSTDEELWEEMVKSLKHVHFWLSSRCETDEVGGWWVRFCPRLTTSTFLARVISTLMIRYYKRHQGKHLRPLSHRGDGYMGAETCIGAIVCSVCTNDRSSRRTLLPRWQYIQRLLPLDVMYNPPHPKNLSLSQNIYEKPLECKRSMYQKTKDVRR